MVANGTIEAMLMLKSTGTGLSVIRQLPDSFGNLCLAVLNRRIKSSGCQVGTVTCQMFSDTETNTALCFVSLQLPIEIFHLDNISNPGKGDEGRPTTHVGKRRRFAQSS